MEQDFRFEAKPPSRTRLPTCLAFADYTCCEPRHTEAAVVEVKRLALANAAHSCRALAEVRAARMEALPPPLSRPRWSRR